MLFDCSLKEIPNFSPESTLFPSSLEKLAHVPLFPLKKAASSLVPRNPWGPNWQCLSLKILLHIYLTLRSKQANFLTFGKLLELHQFPKKGTKLKSLSVLPVVSRTPTNNAARIRSKSIEKRVLVVTIVLSLRRN